MTLENPHFEYQIRSASLQGGLKKKNVTPNNWQQQSFPEISCDMWYVPFFSYWLVVEPTHLKNMLVKLGSSSPNTREHQKSLKQPPRKMRWSHVSDQMKFPNPQQKIEFIKWWVDSPVLFCWQKSEFASEAFMTCEWLNDALELPNIFLPKPLWHSIELIGSWRDLHNGLWNKPRCNSVVFDPCVSAYIPTKAHWTWYHTSQGQLEVVLPPQPNNQHLFKIKFLPLSSRWTF